MCYMGIEQQEHLPWHHHTKWHLNNEDKDGWRLSPAYDQTYSSTYYGEHTTTVDGNGRNPDIKELVAVGTAAGMSKDKCIVIAQDIEKCVKDMLGKYI